MALLTPLPFSEATRLLALYGKELAEITPLAAGSVNSNFLLRTATGEKLFARIYEEQGPSGAQFELEVNLALAAAGVPVSRPVLPTAGGHLVMTGDKPFAVYEQLSGESLCTKMVTPEVTRALGEALARVHLAPLNGLTLPESRFNEAGLQERLIAVLQSGRAELVEAAKRAESLLTVLSRTRSKELPSGLIHGDLFRDNVLVSGSRIAGLLDFESASRGPFVYDIAVTILAWCYGDNLREDATGAFLDGYQSLRPLTKLEKSELSREASFACCRFATTRMTDFSMRVPPGVVPARDYQRFFSRLDAIESGALDRLL